MASYPQPLFLPTDWLAFVGSRSSVYVFGRANFGLLVCVIGNWENGSISVRCSRLCRRLGESIRVRVFGPLGASRRWVEGCKSKPYSAIPALNVSCLFPNIFVAIIWVHMTLVVCCLICSFVRVDWVTTEMKPYIQFTNYRLYIAVGSGRYADFPPEHIEQIYFHAYISPINNYEGKSQVGVELLPGLQWSALTTSS